jgi:hypothetical protein
MRKRAQRKNMKKNFIGMKPFESYDDIKKEELEDLKRMTMNEARIRTEILCKAAEWIK